jgi:hypothetical protein
MVVSSSKDIEQGVVVRDELHDILELMPCLPRLHVLDQLLLGLEYGEDTVLDEDAEIDDEEVELETRKPVWVRGVCFFHVKENINVHIRENVCSLMMTLETVYRPATPNYNKDSRGSIYCDSKVAVLPSQ